MPTNRPLRSALLAKLKVSHQRLSQRTARIKSDIGPMTTEEAVYVLAHREGLDLSRYVGSDVVARVREITQSGASASSARVARAVSRRNDVHEIRLSPVDSAHLVLAAQIVEDASRMAQAYLKLYLLENSIRSIVVRVMETAHGTGWWEREVATDVKNKVDDRRNREANQPWHGKRGTHNINYSDFADLRKIIERNWRDFATLFPSRSWITQRLDELETPRNTVAHSNPLSEQDRDRLDLYLSDWSALLRARWTST